MMNYFKSIDEMCLMDDILMNAVFDDCPKASEEVLRIILGKEDLIVKESKAQTTLISASERSVRLDILASDQSGGRYDIEVQKINDLKIIERAEYYVSLLVSRGLNRGQAYDELKESWVIFICDFDYFGEGLAMYHIDRYVRELPGIKLSERSHIILVNGLYRNDDPIGLLMKDFHASLVSEVSNRTLGERISHFKMTPEGRGNMSEYIQRVFKKELDEARAIARAEARAEAQAEAQAQAQEQMHTEMLRVCGDAVCSLMKKLNVSALEAVNILGYDPSLAQAIIDHLSKTI